MTAAAKLIKGGRIFRAAERDFAPADILVEGERISAVGADLPAPDGVEVIDATGALVTPGLIDFHMHAFRYGHFLSIDADEVAGFSTGDGVSSSPISISGAAVSPWATPSVPACCGFTSASPTR